jgi:hypothetical protein
VGQIERLAWRLQVSRDNVCVMRRTTGLMRALWQITVLLQLILPTFVSIADARAERDAMSARAYLHVEGTTGKDCARAHKPDCALCQHLTTPLAKADKPEPPLYAARCAPLAIERSVVPVTARTPRPSLPRAPPQN